LDLQPLPLLFAMPYKLLLQLFATIRNLTTKHSKATPATPTASMHSCQPSLQTDYVLDRDVLTIELRDPVFRQFYMEHLENCLAMPSFQKQ